MNIYQAELYHHGIKGQKWGIRRYQNPDGMLTAAGQKKYGAQYKKAMIAYQVDRNKVKNKIYIDSYNKTADEYNGGKIAEFNKKHNASDSDYGAEYVKQFRQDWMQNYNRSIMDFSRNNKNFNRAHSLAEKYGLYSCDELAKRNKAFIDDMMKSDYKLDVSSEEAQKKYGPPQQ